MKNWIFYIVGFLMLWGSAKEILLHSRYLFIIPAIVGLVIAVYGRIGIKGK